MPLYDLPQHLADILLEYVRPEDQNIFLLSELADLHDALENPVDADSLLQTWYRVVDKDGHLWAETSSLTECLIQATYLPTHLQPGQYQAREVWVLERPWEPLTPSPEQLAEAERYAREND